LPAQQVKEGLAIAGASAPVVVVVVVVLVLECPGTGPKSGFDDDDEDDDEHERPGGETSRGPQCQPGRHKAHTKWTPSARRWPADNV